MEKYDELWNDINTMLAYLRYKPFSVPWLMDEFFLKQHGNSAPGELMRMQIEKLQQHLDKSEGR